MVVKGDAERLGQVAEVLDVLVGKIPAILLVDELDHKYLLLNNLLICRATRGSLLFPASFLPLRIE